MVSFSRWTGFGTATNCDVALWDSRTDTHIMTLERIMDSCQLNFNEVTKGH